MRCETSKTVSIRFTIQTPTAPVSKIIKNKRMAERQEELRLQGAQIDRPNTKWVFQRLVG